MRSYEIGVYIGRFQPFHAGHLHTIKQALTACDHLMIFIGSILRPRTIKNPFTFDERVQMIERVLDDQLPELRSRVSLYGIEDQFYNDTRWKSDLVNQVKKQCQKGEKIAVVGHEKDESSYYLKWFPNWGFVPIENYKGINATEFRVSFYKDKPLDQSRLLPTIYEDMRKFKATPIFKDLQAEFQFVQDYKASWAKAPFPPLFVTTDALVICQNHILLIERGNYPGKGLWALPGGYLDQNERIDVGVTRELIEETCLAVSYEQLEKAYVTTEVFDHPARSNLGRIITHVGVFKLALDVLPKITAADDAANAKWFNLDSFQSFQPKLHADHYYIVKKMLDFDY